jgi:hypothetical protein
MKKTLLGIFLITTNLIWGQQQKTYTGKYDLHSYNLTFNVGLLKGTATYNYYEDKDLNRIKNGAFSYNGSLSYSGSLTNVSAKGNYSNGNRNGAWTVVFALSDKTIKGQNTFIGNYNNGIPNGLWTLSYNGVQNGIAGNGKYSLNFNKNVINGIFDFTSNTNSIKGKLDNEGFFDGKTIVKESNDEYVFEFKKGVLVSFISRNLQTGKIYDRYNMDSIQLSYLNQLQNSKDSNLLDEIPYRLIEDYNSGTFRLIERLVIKPFYKNFKDYSLFDAFSGDLSINNNNYNWVGFTVLNMEKVETKKERLARIEKEKRVEEERLISQKLTQNISKSINDFKANNETINVYNNDIFKIKYKSLFTIYTEMLNSYNEDLGKYIDSNGFYLKNIDYVKLDFIAKKRNTLSLKIIELYKTPFKSIKDFIIELESSKSIEEKEKLLNIE